VDTQDLGVGTVFKQDTRRRGRPLLNRVENNTSCTMWASFGPGTDGVPLPSPPNAERTF